MDFQSAFDLLSNGCDFSKVDQRQKCGISSFVKKIDLKSVAHSEKTEQIKYILRKCGISVYGTDVPDPVISFNQLKSAYDVSDLLINNIVNMNYTEPTPVQMAAIPAMIERRELIVCAPTGSGKTAAFVLPIVHHLSKVDHPRDKRVIRALIIAPTLELAHQISREAHKLAQDCDLTIHFVDKGLMTWRELKENGLESDPNGEWRYRSDVIITTPNRLVTLITQKPPLISLDSVEWLVVDECDKLFESGKKGFRQQLAIIYKACKSHRVKRALFSATSIPELEEWAKETFDNMIGIRVGLKNTTVSTVSQSLKYCGSEQGKLLEVRMMARKGLDVPCLIFVQSRERAKKLFKELVCEDIMVNVISSDKSVEERNNIVSAFRCGELSVLICTDLLGRGIDFKGVSLVINYDVPASPLEYIHRIGRTGRAGQPGKSVTLWSDDDLPILRGVMGVMRNSGVPVNMELYSLAAKYQQKSRTRTKSGKKKKRLKTPKRAPISDYAPPETEKKAKVFTKRQWRKSKKDAKK